jgi:multicomponent K+:H+ antiporter subunit F
MIEMASWFALGAISLSILLNLYRFLALDTMVINSIGLVVMLGILFGTTMYFEGALLFAMIGFLTTVAFCKFLLRGNIIE